MEFLAVFHPRVVHFPIALFLVYTLLEITGITLRKEFFSRAALLILLLAILGCIAAVLTGNQADQVAKLWEEKGAIIPFGAISEHEEWATYTLWYMVLIASFRIYLVVNKKFSGFLKYIFIVLSLAGCFLIYETGEEGGKLVYKHGVGTDLINPGQSQPE